MERIFNYIDYTLDYMPVYDFFHVIYFTFHHKNACHATHAGQIAWHAMHVTAR